MNLGADTLKLSRKVARFAPKGTREETGLAERRDREEPLTRLRFEQREVDFNRLVVDNEVDQPARIPPVVHRLRRAEALAQSRLNRAAERSTRGMLELRVRREFGSEADVRHAFHA